jgi:predicted Zn-dependent protease
VRSFLPRTLVAMAAVVLLAMPTFGQQKRNDDLENIGNRDINKGGFQPATMSQEQELALGRQLSKELEASVTLLQDPAVTEYISRLGRKIASNSDVKVALTIKVIDSAEINAMALPGGFLYVNTGLITATENEAELAAVMGHALARIAARHAVEQQGRASFLNVLQLPASIFTGGLVGLALSQATASNPQVPTVFFKFDRGMAEEADWLGLQYLYKAGYDPNAMVSFFQKMTAQGPARQTQTTVLFSTHPSNESRAAKTAENIRKFLPAREQNLLTTDDFQNVKARLMERKTP